MVSQSSKVISPFKAVIALTKHYLALFYVYKCSKTSLKVFSFFIIRLSIKPLINYDKQLRYFKTFTLWLVYSTVTLVRTFSEFSIIC